jgi:hypothetical protein
MKNLTLPEKQKDAKQFLLRNLPALLDLFDIPQSIYGFKTHDIARRRIYSMSEESAQLKCDRVKEIFKEW